MTAPMIPVSWGELLDKITILEIKTERLRDPGAAANAARELALLCDVMGDTTSVEVLRTALLAVNTRLWRIEDLIRDKERAGDFGPGFVALARSVYRENDERGRIKQAVNRVLRSTLVEEKQYARY
jgi:hypothetical protein